MSEVNNISEVIIGLAGGILGAILGAWCAVAFPRKAQKRQTILNLMERYTSLEFHIVRTETWKVLEAWRSGDHSIVNYFGTSLTPVPNLKPEKPVQNGLTPHQNLSWFLHFYGNLALYHQANLVDEKLLRKLFKPHYNLHREFISEFAAECRAKGHTPSWLATLPQLEEILDESNTRWKLYLMRSRMPNKSSEPTAS